MEDELNILSEELAVRLYMEELASTERLNAGHGQATVDSSRSARASDEIPDWARGLGDFEWIQRQKEELAIFDAVRHGRQGQDTNGKQRQVEQRQPELPRQVTGRQTDRKGKQRASVADVDCTACMDTITGTVHRLTCNHAYCTDCLKHLVQSSLAGEIGSFPPTCCNEPVATPLAKNILSSANYAKFKERIYERTSEVQLFCPYSRCSARLENRDIKGEIGTCPKCRTKVCTKCKNEEHRGVCKENELVKLAKDEGWKGCPKCGRMVDKLPGTCNHVTCQCGQHFCYKCGRANKGRYENAKNGGCDCPIWNSGDLQQAMEMEPFNPEWAGALEPERDIDEPELVEFADGAQFGRQDRRQHFEGGFDGFRAAAEVARRNTAPIDPPPHRLLRGGIPWGYLPGGIPVDPPILWEDLPPVPQFSRGFGGADLGRGSGARGFVRRPFHLHPPPPPPFGKYWGGPWDRDPDRRSW